MTGRYNTHFRNTYKVMRYKVKIESWMWSTDLLVHHAMMASSMQQYFSRASYKSTTTSSSRAYPLNRISKSMDWGCSFCYTTSWLIRSSAFRYNTDVRYCYVKTLRESYLHYCPHSLHRAISIVHPDYDSTKLLTLSILLMYVSCRSLQIATQHERPHHDTEGGSIVVHKRPHMLWY